MNEKLSKQKVVKVYRYPGFNRKFIGVYISRFWCLKSRKMLEESLAKDYADYFKLDISEELKSVQDIIDNMLTRLDELNSVLLMVKTKNKDCANTVEDDINKYRSEIITFNKKVDMLSDVAAKLSANANFLEDQVKLAEQHFGISNENKIKSFLKPFLKKNSAVSNNPLPSTYKFIELQSIKESFNSES